MSDESAQAPAVEIATGNPVDVFIAGIERTSRSQRVYSQGAGSQKTLDQIYRNLELAYKRLFSDQTEPVDVEVRPNQMICERRVVYENADPRNSLSKLLHSAGIRVLTVKPGAERAELLKFVSVLSTDYSKPENMDADLYSTIKEGAFDNFEVVSEDLIQEAMIADPELKDRLQKFQSWTQRKVQNKNTAESRRLRPDDLKVIEDFQIRTSAFSKPDEEVSQIVKQMTRAAEPGNREKETLERLALMGFHFLVQESDSSQMQVGRDLIIQVARMSLASENVILFGGLLRKVQELHRDRPQKRGEYQKILDSFYHVDQTPFYVKLLSNKDWSEKTLQYILMGPPCTVRLMVMLLGEDPSLIKHLGTSVMKFLPDQLGWLLEEVQKDPNRAAWEQVVNLLASRPNPLFGKFLSKLLESASPTVRVKILRQCAQVGTPDSLLPFRRLLESSKREERMEAYEYLSLAKNKSALGILKLRIEDASFSTLDEEEQAALYAGIFKMGGELAYPMFEAKWMEPGTGLFKGRVQNQRRTALLKAAAKAGQAQYFPKILEKTPDLAPELKQLIDNLRNSRGGAA